MDINLIAILSGVLLILIKVKNLITNLITILS